MLTQKSRLLCAASLIAIFSAGSATAEPTRVSDERIEALQAQIRQLERELGSIKRTVNAAKPAVAYVTLPSKAPAPPPTALVKMSSGNRPSICSADGLNCISLTSRLHFDFGGYKYRPNTIATAPQWLDNGINARRARIGVLGTFMGDWNYALIYDFGGSSDGFGGSVASSGGITTGLLPGGGASGIQNAYLSYTGIKPFGGTLAIEGGYMDALFTLDEATSSNDILFMERASPGVIATNIAAGDFRSVAGIRWYNDWAWFGAYATGPTSGAIHSASSAFPPGVTEQYGTFGRMAFQLINEKTYSLHVGGGIEALLRPPVNLVTGTQTLTLGDRPELRLDPTTLISTGGIANVIGAQVYNFEAAATFGPFYAQGEYFRYKVERQSFTGRPDLQFEGWYAEAAFSLTGETRSYNAGNAAYNGIVPNTPFSWNSGGWGAWEIAGRYSAVNLNDRLGFAAPDGVAGGKQTIWTAGLNWYVNRNIRFMFNYLYANIDKQVSPTNTADIGSEFNAFAGRMQVAF